MVPSSPGNRPDSLAEERFQLLEVIGEGGMATVYRAFDQRLQRPRAIKVLSPNLALRASLRRRFLAEAQTMANLEESRVVRIFDMGEDGDRVYIVMELVEGGSLLDRVRNFGPLPPRMAAEATVQLCESLQAAHDAGVIHRDIKPHNVLLTHTGELRVTDFGIAQVQTEDGDGMTRTGALMGTWGFMAPEQKTNAKQVDARADIYSVGATLWSLLKGDTPPELFMADTEPGMLDGIPEELAEAIKRATRYRREERYVTARAMADSLRAFVPMLPEDPPDTAPLAPPAVARPRRKLDTVQQFVSEVPEVTNPRAANTLVSEAARAPDERAARVASRPTLVAESLSAPSETIPEDPTIQASPSVSPRMPWLGFVPGAALLALVLAGAVLFWPGNPEAPVLLPGPSIPPGPLSPGDQAPSSPTSQAAVTDALPDALPDAATQPKASELRKPAAPAAEQPVVPAPVVPPIAPSIAPSIAPPDPAIAANTLVYTPPAAVRLGEPLRFVATIQGGWTVKVYFRGATDIAFDNRTLVPAGTGHTFSLKTTEAMAGGVSYFLEATKDGRKERSGSPTNPHKVAILPP